MSKFLNISTDNTLGGNNASNEVVSAQKAVKDYVDNNIPTYTAGTGIDITNDVISVDGEQASLLTLATVATTGAYSDLTGQPTIPTVNNATLTITQGGTTKGTFTANASSNVTIDLDSGGSWGNITGTLSNQTDLNNALSGKVNTSDLATVHVVVDTYENGTSWYRVYSDGWCEQGGRATVPQGANVDITFLIPYANTDYYVNGNQTYNWSDNPGGYVNAIFGMPRTDGFSMRASTGPLGSIWMACGYIS